ncbi:RNA-directed DNA polymerase [Thorsellia kenyensis]|uniref:RNA-directed DNA polymerase n=1 Tax=Thorsellia kenyensis TaxID=1549888 RepID=A0ABV6CBN0_9GAMM
MLSKISPIFNKIKVHYKILKRSNVVDLFLLLSNNIYKLFSTDQIFHAEQRNDGIYLKKSGSVSVKKILDVIKNKNSIAVYQRNINNTIKWICYDFDILKSQLNENRENAKKELFLTVTNFCEFLEQHKIPYLIEHSGNRGIHIWITFKQSIPFNVSYDLASLLLQKARLNYNSNLIAIDLFPSSNKKSANVGACVKLPLSKHKKSGYYSYFINSYKELNNIVSIDTLSPELIKTQNEILERHNSTVLEEIEQKLNLFLSREKDLNFTNRYKRIIINKLNLDELLKHWEKQPPLTKLKNKIIEGNLNNQERKLLVGILLNVYDINNTNIGKMILIQILEKQKNYNASTTNKAINNLSSYFFPSKEQIEESLKERFTRDNANLLDSIFVHVIGYNQGYFDFCKSDIEITRNAEIKYFFQNDEAQSRNIFNQLNQIIPDEYLQIVNKFIDEYPNSDISYYVHERHEKDKKRELISLDCLERITTSLIMKQMHYFLDFSNSSSSFGYRIVKGFKKGYIFEPWLYLWIQFLSQISTSIKNKSNFDFYIIKTDITSFYDNINHDILKRLLLNNSPLETIRNKINELDSVSIEKYKKLISICVDISKKTTNSEKGLPQGPAYARFFAELYLAEIDSSFDELLSDGSIILYQRYVDDIFIICRNENEAIQQLNYLNDKLNFIGLELNKVKTSIKKVKDFLPDFNEYRSQSKYSVDKISHNFLTATEEEKNFAVNEFINLMNSQFNHEDYSFIYSHLKDVELLAPFKNNQIVEIINNKIGRGSLYKNLFIYILSNEDNWPYLASTKKFTSLQSEVLTSIAISFIEEKKILNEKIKDLFSRLIDKLTPSKIVNEHLIQMNLLVGLDINEVKIPPKIILDTLSIFPHQINTHSTDYFLDYINTEINNLHDKYKFIYILYNLSKTDNITSMQLNKIASLFFSYFSNNMKNKEFDRIDNSINEGITYSIKYYYLLSLFSLSNINNSLDLLKMMWKYCAQLFNNFEFEITSYIDYNWIHQVRSISIEPKKHQVILSSIVDGTIFRGVSDEKHVFENYHSMLLISLSDSVIELNFNEIDNLLEKNINSLLQKIKNESLFYDWIINRDKTKLFPSTREWFDCNIIHNNTIMLRRGNEILIRKPFISTRCKNNKLPNYSYTEKIESYDSNELYTVSEVISEFKLDELISFLSKEIEIAENNGFPNIFTNTKLVRKNSLTPFTSELFFSKYYLFEENNHSVSFVEASKDKFVELIFKKYLEFNTSKNIDIYEKYISKLPDSVEITIFIKQLAEQFSKLHVSDDIYSNNIINLCVASAFYSSINKDITSMQKIEEFQKFYHINSSDENLYVYSIDIDMSINDSSLNLFIDSIIAPIKKTKESVYPNLTLDIDNIINEYLQGFQKILEKTELDTPISTEEFSLCQITIKPLTEQLILNSSQKFSFGNSKIINYHNNAIDDLSINNTFHVNSASHIYQCIKNDVIYIIPIPSYLSKMYQYIQKKFNSLNLKHPKTYSIKINQTDSIEYSAEFDQAINVIMHHKQITLDESKDILSRWLNVFPHKFREIFVILIASHQYMTKREIDDFCDKVLHLVKNNVNVMMIKKIEDHNGTIRCFHTNTKLSRKLAYLTPDSIDLIKSDELSLAVDVIISGSQICDAMKFYFSDGNNNKNHFDITADKREHFKKNATLIKKINIYCILYTQQGIDNIKNTLLQLIPTLNSNNIEVVHGKDVGDNAFFGTTTSIGNQHKNKILDILSNEEECQEIYNLLASPNRNPSKFKRHCVLNKTKLNNMNLIARYKSLPKKSFEFLYLGLKTNDQLHPFDRILESGEFK